MTTLYLSATSSSRLFFFLNFCISIENNKNLACHLPTLPNSRSCEVTAVLFIWLQLLWPWQQWRDEDCEGIWGMQPCALFKCCSAPGMDAHAQSVHVCYLMTKNKKKSSDLGWSLMMEWRQEMMRNIVNVCVCLTAESYRNWGRMREVCRSIQSSKTKTDGEVIQGK